MMQRTTLIQHVIPAAVLSLLGLSCGGCGDQAGTVNPPSPSDSTPGAATIQVDPATRYQVMTGWQAVAQVGETECQGYELYQAELFRRAANELGINRLEVQVRGGSENPRDWFGEYLRGEIDRPTLTRNWYTAVNDNDDPHSIEPGGFHFSELDLKIDLIVLPLRRELAARGEELFVMLRYLDHGPGAWEHADEPEEYAELLLATFQHMQSKYGFVPDAIELINEPDNSNVAFTARQMGPAAEAAGRRLKAAGFNVAIVAPSTLSMTRTVSYFDDLARTTDALQYITEISYHRYGSTSRAALEAIAARAQQHGMKTSMLEHINSGHEDLYEDLTVAQVSAWEQYGLAFCDTDGSNSGSRYYWIDASNPAKVAPTNRTRHLWQYFRYVRMGAQRIGATSTNANLQPVAFENTNGSQVVVVNASDGETFTVGGLPPGTYGITFTTADEDGALPDTTLSDGGLVSAGIPAKGVIAIFRK